MNDELLHNNLRRWVLFNKNDLKRSGMVLQAGGLTAISRWLSEATPPVRYGYYGYGVRKSSVRLHKPDLASPLRSTEWWTVLVIDVYS